MVRFKRSTGCKGPLGQSLPLIDRSCSMNVKRFPSRCSSDDIKLRIPPSLCSKGSRSLRALRSWSCPSTPRWSGRRARPTPRTWSSSPRSARTSGCTSPRPRSSRSSTWVPVCWNWNCLFVCFFKCINLVISFVSGFFWGGRTELGFNYNFIKTLLLVSFRNIQKKNILHCTVRNKNLLQSTRSETRHH